MEPLSPKSLSQKTVHREIEGVEFTNGVAETDATNRAA